MNKSGFVIQLAMAQPGPKRKGALLQDGKKRCSRCLKSKTDKDFFYSCKTKADGLHNNCKECHWEMTLCLFYNLTVEEYREMLRKQDNKCAICRTPVEECLISQGNRLYVDHNHTTGKARGLVCHPCNCIIGVIENNPDKVSNTLRYLRENDRLE